jgi:hypothetical protein
MDEQAFPFFLTDHARVSLRRRPMPLEWIQRTIEQPQRTERDRDDPELQHALLAIPEHDNRVLRVVYNQTTTPYRVVTVYFDRRMKGQL